MHTVALHCDELALPPARRLMFGDWRGPKRGQPAPDGVSSAGWFETGWERSAGRFVIPPESL